jgi:hypothetical protein
MPLRIPGSGRMLAEIQIAAATHPPLLDAGCVRFAILCPLTKTRLKPRANRTSALPGGYWLREPIPVVSGRTLHTINEILLRSVEARCTFSANAV